MTYCTSQMSYLPYQSDNLEGASRQLRLCVSELGGASNLNGIKTNAYLIQSYVSRKKAENNNVSLQRSK